MIVQTNTSSSPNSLIKTMRSSEKIGNFPNMIKTQVDNQVNLDKPSFDRSPSLKNKMERTNNSYYSMNKKTDEITSNRNLPASPFPSIPNIQTTKSYKSDPEELMRQTSKIRHQQHPKSMDRDNLRKKTLILSSDITDNLRLKDLKKVLKEVQEKNNLKRFELPTLAALRYITNNINREKNTEKPRGFVFSKMEPGDIYGSGSNSSNASSGYMSNYYIEKGQNTEKLEKIIEISTEKIHETTITDVDKDHSPPPPLGNIKDFPINIKDLTKIEKIPKKDHHVKIDSMILLSGYGANDLPTPRIDSVSNSPRLRQFNTTNYNNNNNNTNNDGSKTDRNSSRRAGSRFNRGKEFLLPVQNVAFKSPVNQIGKNDESQKEMFRSTTYDSKQKQSPNKVYIKSKSPKVINIKTRSPSELKLSSRRINLIDCPKLQDNNNDQSKTERTNNQPYSSQLELFNRCRQSTHYVSNRNSFFTDNGVEFFNFNPENMLNNYIENNHKSPDNNNNNKRSSPGNKKQEPMKNSMPILAEYDENTVFIQPSFMKQSGTMCFTEFWADKDKREYSKLMKGDLQTVKIRDHQDLFMLESLYKPDKIKETCGVMNKITNQNNAHGNEYLMLMKPQFKRYKIKHDNNLKKYDIRNDSNNNTGVLLEVTSP